MRGEALGVLDGKPSMDAAAKNIPLQALEPTRVVYFGTPAFAVPALQALASSRIVDLVGVVTQPDRPAGRGRRLQAPPVKTFAEARGLPLLQVSTLRDPAARSWLIQRDADLFVVAAFGLILSRRTLAMPGRGAINIHASLLPRYRGASPVASAIANGERQTGVSLMQMEVGLDTGPVYAQSVVDITDEDTTATLTERLAESGAQLLTQTLPSILDGSLRPELQRGTATLTRPLVKEDGRIDWSRPAGDIFNQVRAMMPWPRAFTTLPSGAALQVLKAQVVDRPQRTELTPGTVFVAPGQIGVICGVDALSIEVGQLPGSRPNSAAQLLQRRAMADGDCLGSSQGPVQLPSLVTEIASEAGDLPPC